MTSKKTAIVTGAGTGIGKAAALALLSDGWNTILAGRRRELLDDVVSEAGAAHALAVPCDVTDPGEIDNLFKAAVEAFGRVDMLFNNAGASAPATLIDEMPLESWDTVVSVNLTGSFLCARAAFRQMRRQTPQGGRIINNGSISAHAPRPGSVPYTVSKHAITGLTRTLALDGRPFDIACGQIDIGNAMTDLAAPISEGVPQANGEIAAEPMMDVRHAADAVLHMANLPLGANVLFMTVMATKMPFAGRG